MSSGADCVQVPYFPGKISIKQRVNTVPLIALCKLWSASDKLQVPLTWIPSLPYHYVYC